MFTIVAALLISQAPPVPNLIAKLEPMELRQQIENGKYFQPWVLRIRQGDPWAMAELTLACNKLGQSNFPFGLGDMAKLVIPIVGNCKTSDPGRACYYIAELTRIFSDPGKRDAGYIALLEESSRHGYPWADLRLYEESKQGGANSRLKLASIKDREQHMAMERELQIQCKEKAFRRLLPLALQGDVEAQQRVYNLQEPKFDYLLDKAQAKALLEDSASRGSIRAQMQIENIKRSDSNPGHPDYLLVEDSPSFRSLERAADQYDPISIQLLVDFYVGKKEWVKAKKWATKGKDALGGTNRWLESAWNDVSKSDEETLEKHD